MANAQKSELVGSWLMTKAEFDGKVETPYFITEFKEEGNFLLMGIDFGTWTYNSNDNSIQLKSALDKDFNGKSEILNLTRDELIVSKDGAKLTYKRVDVAEITQANSNSGLLGMWEFKNMPHPEENALLTFSEPDEFVMIERAEYSTATNHGTWIFDKQEQSLIMIGNLGENGFKGKNKVVMISEDAIELENNGKIFKGQWKPQNAGEIERLTFTESDFFTEDGDYKYSDDEEKLPWRDWSAMKMSLLNIKQLVYNYSTLIDGTQAFESKVLRANVQSDIEEEGFTIDNIFNGYDRYNLPDGAELPQDSDYSEPLYPLEDSPYRIVGNEQITTPAGTFDCTMVETVSSAEVLKKLWMITDKPGIYARIIDDNPDETFGHYSVYELQKID
jgi:hypothetical protein